eukprot:614279-Rhodomonas_salina.1
MNAPVGGSLDDITVLPADLRKNPFQFKGFYYRKPAQFGDLVVYEVDDTGGSGNKLPDQVMPGEDADGTSLRVVSLRFGGDIHTVTSVFGWNGSSHSLLEFEFVFSFEDKASGNMLPYKVVPCQLVLELQTGVQRRWNNTLEWVEAWVATGVVCTATGRELEVDRVYDGRVRVELRAFLRSNPESERLIVGRVFVPGIDAGFNPHHDL